MAAPPPKRQRKLVVLSSDNEDETLSLGDDNNIINKKNNNDKGPERKLAKSPTSSRRQEPPSKSPAKTRARPQKPASSNNKKRKETATNNSNHDYTTSPRSLHKFFQPATEEQRWAAHRPAAIPRREERPGEIEDDLIEDDEYGSFDDDIFEHLSSKDTVAKLPNRPRKQPQQQQQQQQRARASKPRPSKRFILDDNPAPIGAQTKPEVVDRRPWPERYAPANIEELAVHKKKVADVRSWLTAALSGRTRHKMLVLHGPAGSGKTTTISLLSHALGFSIVEWKGPVGTESADGKYTSLNAQFDEFLNRTDSFGSLDLSDSPRINSATNESQAPASQRIILIEEFPNSLSRGSSALSAFRTSLRRYLASDPPLSGGVRTTPPVVIVISETRLATSASISDNLTMHRLLGPEIYTNPGASTIEFNPIAPTFMRKALDLILKKEARDSMRQRIPGPGVLKKFSELGDIRSAISSLQFFCLRGDKDGDWGGRVAAKAKSAGRDDASLTIMEKDSLEMISQRESSLGLFHAVGKVVYNKREDMTPEQQRDRVMPPPHLQHLERPKASLVSIEDLINETGTDIQTFTAALHENYPPSCDGPSFTDSLTACIEHLSDSDLLGSESRSSLSSSRMGIGMARSQFQGYGISIDRLRQDEVSFHVAVRGLLFSLPCPVRRKLEGGSGKRSSDTYKMHFPTSQRLWKDMEEMDGLIGIWERRLLDPTTTMHHSTASRPEGVESWKLNQMNANANDRNFGPDIPPRSMMSREDVLLHQLPYLTKILGGNNGSSQTQGLDRITQFRGKVTAPADDDIPDDMLNDTEPSSVNEWSTDPVLPARRNGRPGFQASKEAHVNMQEAVENLLLSDDEIED
ncbi:Cell cycle checkpoint protein RAD17 [Talaromyces islandicus]|uniref:Cell cycle checkpoint protein RAD17 n=1 Tax=Talaromyces islandicus TaxID=28573 RepID=A0A0U1M306_TALIS|nr:Cell cycle checkpoint protein RAD17 [Talaromyces islandicus]